MKKIVTVTLNPAVDQTVFLDRLSPGEVNRVIRMTEDAGGKGINVSKTLRALGADSVATGLLGVKNGAVIEESLDKAGIKHDFVPVQGTVRTNLKLAEADGRVTEINEAGGEVRREELAALERKLLSYAGQDVLFVFSGSAPPGTGTDLYERLIRSVHEKGAEALLDAAGALFACGMRAFPDIIKPNREELAEYITDFPGESAGRNAEGQDGPETWRDMGMELIRRGAGVVLLSCGAQGAVFLKKEGECVRQTGYPALSVPVCSTVGAGDAMAAAYCYGRIQGMDFEEAARLCMAVSAGAVMTEGTKPPEPELVKRLLQEVPAGLSFQKP